MIPQFEGLSREQRRAMLRQLERDNRAWPEHLVDCSAEALPRWRWDNGKPIAVLRSRSFMCQVFEAPGGVIRLSFNRTTMDETTWRWADGITWDDLQRLKREAGFGEQEAVEVYPPDGDVVNVGNLRHLWVLPHPLPFAWRRS